MKELSDDVWNDLAALYLAGEASPGTRVLLEQRGAQNAEFAARLGMARQFEFPAPDVPIDKEMEALKMTRQHVFLRTLFCAMAVAFTLIPFLFVFRGGEIVFFMWRDAAGAARGILSVGAAAWVAFYVMHRRVRSAGL